MASTVSHSFASNISGGQSLQVPRHDNSPTPLPPQTSGAAGLNYYTELNPQFMLQRKWAPEKENIVRAPFNYSISNPGKDFRTQFIHAFQAWLGVPQDSLDIISKAVSLLHEASLLVDDIQDASALRRGAPTAYNIFGIAQTINSANYIYFAVLQELQKLDNPAATSIFMEELMNLHRGQGMDLYWRDSLVCPSEDDYLEMVGNKTGGLFRLSVKLMQAEVTSFDLDYVSLANLIGIIFQIRDDYMNLTSTQYNQAKGFCEDLTEGKFSLPVIYSVRASPEKPELLNVLKQRTSDSALKCWAVKHMAGMGSLEYTRNVVEILVQKARELTEKVDRGRGQATGIHKILDMVAT